MTIQPVRHECHACCPLQAEKPGIQPVVGNTHDTHVEQVVSSFQKVLRGSQLTYSVFSLVTCLMRCYHFLIRWQSVTLGNSRQGAVRLRLYGFG